MNVDFNSRDLGEITTAYLTTISIDFVSNFLQVISISSDQRDLVPYKKRLGPSKKQDYNLVSTISRKQTTMGTKISR